MKLRYIGDTLTLLPVIENLKKKVPTATVDVMVNRGTEGLLKDHPGVRRLWVYDRRRAKDGPFSALSYHRGFLGGLRRERYDLVIDFTNGDRAAFIAFMTGAPQRVTYEYATALSHLLMNRVVHCDHRRHHVVDYQLESLRSLGLDDFDRTVRLSVPDAAVRRMQAFLTASGIPSAVRKVAIHPGARRRLRQWSPRHFARIADRFRREGDTAVILVGGPGEKRLLEEVEGYLEAPAALSLTGLGLIELAALLSCCSLFIGNDSAPGHIAGAVNCPNLALFGPTFPHMWRPLSPVGQVLFKELPCCGCRQEVCVRPEKTCMDLIEVEEVWEKAQELLGHAPGPQPH